MWPQSGKKKLPEVKGEKGQDADVKTSPTTRFTRYCCNVKVSGAGSIGNATNDSHILLRNAAGRKMFLTFFTLLLAVAIYIFLHFLQIHSKSTVTKISNTCDQTHALKKMELIPAICKNTTSGDVPVAFAMTSKRHRSKMAHVLQSLFRRNPLRFWCSCNLGYLSGSQWICQSDPQIYQTLFVIRGRGHNNYVSHFSG